MLVWKTRKLCLILRATGWPQVLCVDGEWKQHDWTSTDYDMDFYRVILSCNLYRLELIVSTDNIFICIHLHHRFTNSTNTLHWVAIWPRRKLQNVKQAHYYSYFSNGLGSLRTSYLQQTWQCLIFSVISVTVFRNILWNLYCWISFFFWHKIVCLK